MPKVDPVCVRVEAEEVEHHSVVQQMKVGTESVQPMNSTQIINLVARKREAAHISHLDKGYFWFLYMSS